MSDGHGWSTVFDMNEIVYAGIGSRKTPAPLLSMMTKIGRRCAERGAILRSGAALGADSAFEAGARAAGGRCEIFVPGLPFGSSPDPIVLPPAMMQQAMMMAQAVHPAWPRCSDWVKRAHGRNAAQIFGRDLNSPVRFVVCWAPLDTRAGGASGEVTGGTRTAVELARRSGIPVFNLAERGALERFYAFASELFAAARS